MNLTKKRIELLQAVADGSICDRYSIGDGWIAVWDHGPGSGRRFTSPTAAIWLLHNNGLIAVGPRPADWHSDRLWELTDEGRKALEANGGRT